MLQKRALLEYLRRFVLVGSYFHLWYLNAVIVAVLLVSFCLKRRWKPGWIVAIFAGGSEASFCQALCGSGNGYLCNFMGDNGAFTKSKVD